MLEFLASTRQIVRYHDVTPGSQITWNTAFLAVTSAWKRAGKGGGTPGGAWARAPAMPSLQGSAG